MTKEQAQTQNKKQHTNNTNNNKTKNNIEDTIDKTIEETIGRQKKNNKTNSFGKGIGKFFKTIIYTGLIVGAIYAGEKYKPIQTIENIKTFYNRSVEDNNPKDFTNYKILNIINQKGRIQTYFGNVKKNQFHRVLESGNIDTNTIALDKKYINKTKMEE